MKPESQRAQILEYLKSGHTLTPIEALQRFGSLRLAAVVHEFKRQGYEIKAEYINVGDRKNVARYSLNLPTR